MSQTKAQLIDPVDGTIVNADINASAAIAGSKISPDFGSQNIVTTGGLTVDTTTLKVDASNNRVGIGTASPDTLLHAKINTFSDDINKVALTLSNNQSSGVHQYFQNASTGTGVSNGARIGLGNTDNFLIQHFEAKDIQISTNGSEAMRINSSGDIGIGTTSMAGKLNVQGSAGGVALQTTDATNSTFRISHPSAAVTLLSGGSSQHLALGTGFAEKMRIDSSGQVGIGVTPDTWSTGAGITVGTSQGTLWGSGDQINLSGNAYFNSGWKAAASKAGASQIEQALGNIDFKVSGSVTADSAITFTNAMRINSSGNVGIGTTSPARLLHQHVSSSAANYHSFTNDTTGSGSGNGLLLGINQDEESFVWNYENTNLRFGTNNSERMRIDSSGVLSIGTTSPNGSASKLQVEDSGENNVYFVGNTTTSGARLILQNKNTTANSFTGILGADGGAQTTSQILFYNADNANNEGYMTFETRPSGGVPTERMRINSSGKVGIGTTIQDHLLHVKGSSAVLKIDHTSTGDTKGVVMRHARGGLSGFTGKMISFIGNDNTEEGSIVIGTTATAFNTSSDYRLKENEVAISDGITRLKQLKPYIFNFKKDPDTTVDGFFAHEVQSVVPEAITGTKDEVDSDNNPVYQGIDQSKLVPLLVAAVQELITKVETLEAA